MNLLGERESEAVRSVLSSLERDVAVTLELGPTAAPVTLLAAGGREIDTGEQTRAVVEDVCSLSDRVTLAVVERDEPGPWPRTTIGPGLHYLGMPLGYDLAGDPEPVRARFPAGTERIVVWPFVADAPAGWEPTLDHEHVEARWLHPEDAIALLEYPEPKEIVRRASA